MLPGQAMRVILVTHQSTSGQLSVGSATKQRMRQGHRFLVVGTLAVIVVESWPTMSTGETESVDKLTKASECTFHGSQASPGQHVTNQMAVKNDGGWCWSSEAAWRGNGTYYSADDLVITVPPKHGNVVVGDMANHRIRVAYRPEPGFSGQDSYTFHFKVLEIEHTVIVTVSMPISHGVHTYANGNRYDGEWQDDKPNGHGVYTWANGDRYDGEWRNGKQNGHGVFIWANGDRYDGEWQDDKKVGQGTEVRANGSRYDGVWQDDLPNGLGEAVFANGTKRSGVWAKGCLRTGDGTVLWDIHLPSCQ